MLTSRLFLTWQMISYMTACLRGPFVSCCFDKCFTQASVYLWLMNKRIRFQKEFTTSDVPFTTMNVEQALRYTMSGA
ncbi:hypothetical protein EDC96DRAFT_533937 [Choanephora cucurbitarum]|nr:hypothetical protein EDC96DRAFT_533937 [Choanephora cucurbitarum]